MKCISFDDCHKLLEDFIKSENLVRLIEDSEGKEETRGLTCEDISRYLKERKIGRIYNVSENPKCGCENVSDCTCFGSKVV